MDKNITKMLVLPQDGSSFAMRSLDYIHLVFGPSHNLTPVLMHILPSMPQALVDEGLRSKEINRQLQQIEKRNEKNAGHVLQKAKEVLVQYGFDPDKIKTVYQKRKTDIARDIACWSEEQMADGLVLSSHGRSWLETFFIGEVSMKLLECCRTCPVWMIRGVIKSRHVLVAVDNSEHALRSVDYAGFMLQGTNSRITLFHGKPKLRRFLPRALFEDMPGIEEALSRKTDETIHPVMEKAKEMLVQAGVEENKITIEITSGSNNPAKDILEAVRKHDCGTIVLGRQGDSNTGGFSMGSFTRKVLEGVEDMAVWVV
ncbi:MAG: universal stress protein [Desulfobacteraceae bacterium]|nr:MAG: universal stress protein [Desulfobacteraceae bacterium]